MKPLVLAPTAQTPLVDFNAKTGVLKLEGRSWSENINQFYTPLSEWVKEYSESARPETNFYISLEYFNSASSKLIYKLFLKLTDLVDHESKFTIHWHYQSNDEEMKEVGEEYRAAIYCNSNLYDFKIECIDA